jgi:glycosyltransferase involved in cell wall biosynthesis
MRVLQLTDLYAPLLGGLERHVEVLSRELVRRGHRVAVATVAAAEGSPAYEEDDGLAIHRLTSWAQRARLHAEPAKPFHPNLPDPGVAAQLRRVIARERPDVVHAHSWIVYSFLPLKAWSGARLVLSMHHFGMACPKLTYVHRGGMCDGPAYAKCVACAREQYGLAKAAVVTTAARASAPLNRGIDRWVAVSPAVARPVVEHARHARDVRVVPVFLAPETARAAAGRPRPSFLPAQGGFLLFAGVLGPHKGVDVLLDAYRRLREPPPLVLLGPPHRDMPREVPPGVTVALDVPHADVMAAWRECILGVVPSVWPEPFGTVALEAMSCGRPLVASAVGGLADVVVDGETGLLVPPGDPAALAEAIAALLADPDRRARLGAAGRRRCETVFAASTVVPELEAIYADVLCRPARA